MKRLLLAVVGALIGCGTAESASVCADRSGTYVFTLVAQSGDCGDIAPSVRDVSEPAALAPDCTRDILSYSIDNCDEIETNVVCKDPDRGTVSRTSHMVWSADGTQGTGEESLVVERKDGTRCSGVYSATAVRQ